MMGQVTTKVITCQAAAAAESYEACSAFTTILFHLMATHNSLLEKKVQEINCQC
ncbi:hypothetical protein ACTHQ8_21840 [Lysinibacillus odysseyi]